MNTPFELLLRLLAVGVFLGPIIVGFAISLAVVGKARRWQWLLISIPTYAVLAASLVLLSRRFGSPEVAGMLAFGAIYGSAAVLIPAALLFSRLASRRHTQL